MQPLEHWHALILMFHDNIEKPQSWLQGAGNEGPRGFVAVIGTDDGSLHRVTVKSDSLACSVRKLGAAVAESPAGGVSRCSPLNCRLILAPPKT